MHFGNVKLLDGDMGVLDFDDSLWCFPVQDIGISFYYLQFRPNSAELMEAFRRGYTEVRPWPEEREGQVWDFVRARALDLIDVYFQLDEPGIQSALPRLIAANEAIIL